MKLLRHLSQILGPFWAAVGMLAIAAVSSAATVSEQFRKVVFGCYSNNVDDFAVFALRAKQSGATHIVLTAEDLPWARWQYDAPGDPYPAWMISNHGLLKVAVPEALKGYIPKEYSDGIMQVLRDRSRTLGQLGLKGVFFTFEPQALPEQVYEDHPLWRGPEVANPVRAKVPRFAPNVDNPEVLGLYREALSKLVAACPQIDLLSFHTNDSGSGMSWSRGLYPGANGSSLTKGKRMYQRYRDFFAALRAGAADAGSKNLEVDVIWDREEAPELIASRLEAGTAIANREGPKSTPYKAEVGYLLDYFYPYYPACGIPVPVSFLEELERAYGSSAPRLFVLIGDRFNRDLYFSIYDAFAAHPTRGLSSRLDLLREVSTQRVGKENVEQVLEAWMALRRAEEDVKLLDRGGTVFYLGSVQQRWLTRPYVPFPEELGSQERDYYRRYQFQATTERRAEDLHELQGSRDYSGQGGHLLADKILDRIHAEVEDARHKLEHAAGHQSGKDSPDRLLDDRLRVFECLLNNCRNAIDYQYYLDVVKNHNLKRPLDVGAITSIPEWSALRETARNEIDNTAVLIELLDAGRRDLIHAARNQNETDIRIFEPELTQSLRTKLRIMSRHWDDYMKLFAAQDDSASTYPSR